MAERARAKERVLRLDFECLESLPGGLREVRTWLDNITGGEFCGKRLDISTIDQEGVLLEPALLQQVDHDNVVPVFAAAVVDGYPQPMRVVEIVMPYYRRGSVTDALLRGERFTVSEACLHAQAALRGLGELHEQHGVLHRDVKSSNLLLTDDAHRLKVGDLGLAGKMDAAGTCPALDNPQLYSPPELVATGVWTRESDVFAMGLVLRELLGGPFPYDDYTTSEISSRLVRGISPLRLDDALLPVWTPRDLRRIVRKATNRRPAARYRTAREIARAISRASTADWTEVSVNRWEAACRQPGRRVAVEAARTRAGTVRLSLLGYRTVWRRVVPDTVVPALRSAAAAAVFDHATKIASAR
jgi:serine/threonine protein kinase